MHLVLWVCTLATTALMLIRAELQTVYEWKYLDFLWESDEQKQNAIRTGKYNLSRVLPSDLALAKDGRIFVSHIGYIGTPVRLSIVSGDSIPTSGPLLLPYPDWSWHTNGDCNGITSVYGLAIDQCNRLWVLDTGILEYASAKACPAQLLAFDLTRNKLTKRIKIPNHIAQNNQGMTRLVKPIVETKGQQCDHTTVYMTDSVGHGLVIWNGIGLFRLEGEVYNPIDSARNVSIGDYNPSVAGGVVDMSLSPNIFPYEPRYLFFRPLASYDLYAANTRELTRSIYGYRIKYFGARDILTSQAVGQAFSSDGTLFLGLTREMAIACWNRYREMAKENIEIVSQDDKRLQYTIGVKVVPKSITKTSEELWVLTNRFVQFQLHVLNFNDINFRILKSPVKDLVEGTKCEMPAQLKAALRRTKANLTYKYPK
ncbi:PREDICTED: major royal jelly protein 1-like [Ceratosolen solmsi marchali]|uniref:Major royal jelly protein 1-like n=1 Tax=Ceratosolen solmsi marchali TaxID=326594 RepID=A0AAJ7E2D3_9HYME|nr:PREDICTED: major royal jelly protein 1-like [Ceratosolen solmsi marchali]